MRATGTSNPENHHLVETGCIRESCDPETEQGEGMGEQNLNIQTGSRRTPETVYMVLIVSLTGFTGTGKAALPEQQDLREIPSPQVIGPGDEIPVRSSDQYRTDRIQGIHV
jgi:hypothetical protein